MSRDKFLTSRFSKSPAPSPQIPWTLEIMPAPTCQVVGDPAVPATGAAVLKAAEPLGEAIQGPPAPLQRKAPAWKGDAMRWQDSDVRQPRGFSGTALKREFVS